MIPAPFDYVEADSVDAAIGALGQHGDEAKLMAGGHSLIPLMKFRLATPSVIVDIGRLSGLDGITDAGDHVSIGALATHHQVGNSELLQAQTPILAHVASRIGDPSVRHKGTIGGSLAHADPASDLPAALLALGGSVVAKGPSGEREIAAADLFTGFLESALADDEMLTEVRVPKVPDAGWSYQKINRRAQDWALVAVAAVRANGTTNVALVNMGPTPVMATAAQTALASGASIDDAAAVAAEGCSPPEDLNGDAAYRSHLACVLTKRALEEIAN